jgi:hypothetical protein
MMMRFVLFFVFLKRLVYNILRFGKSGGGNLPLKVKPILFGYLTILRISVGLNLDLDDNYNLNDENLMKN